MKTSPLIFSSSRSDGCSSVRALEIAFDRTVCLTYLEEHERQNTNKKKNDRRRSLLSIMQNIIKRQRILITYNIHTHIRLNIYLPYRELWILNRYNLVSSYIEYTRINDYSVTKWNASILIFCEETLITRMPYL